MTMLFFLPVSFMGVGQVPVAMHMALIAEAAMMSASFGFLLTFIPCATGARPMHPVFFVLLLLGLMTMASGALCQI